MSLFGTYTSKLYTKINRLPTTNIIYTMKKRSLLWLMLVFSCVTLFAKSRELKVLQMNLWHEGTQVKGGFDAIANEIVRLDPDIVMFSEIRNYHGKKFMPRILKALEERGAAYNGEHSAFGDVSTITKHKIIDHHPIRVRGNSLSKTRIEIDNKIVVVYSCHLDYTHDASFLPRGYSGTTWKKLDGPVTDNRAIEKAGRESTRGEGLQAVLADADTEKGNIILIGGDFNEPSHLDWNEKTKDLWDHNGTVVNWECSMMLEEKGYVDSYRKIHPNPVTHPAFTFPAYLEGVAIKRLAWAPTSDERCRLDYIHYMPHKKLKVKSSNVVGPEYSIIRGQKGKETSKDKIITPLNVWPSDHKAMLTVFKLKE